VYGNPRRVPIPEHHPLDPINPYGNTKLAMERAIGDAATAHGWRATVLRYFNAAGACPEAGLAERHEPETHLVPLAVRAALDRRRVLRIFGDDYATADGTCIRDYIHVMDLAEAHVLALARLLDGEPGSTLNLGTGRGHSVREVVETTARVVGRRPRVKVTARRPGDPPRLVASPRRAREELRFRAGRSGLERIVEDAWAALRR
jgi:UDP-glucose-4-epimerase GalE